ncbi:hypothetical protein QJS04_geneDACA017178 [Acorus gramineus]|uniref:Uncharacterized protein n=1 Tax=Acorus gramineus TaxID=55184 RepID=A0AAV9BLT5_ACOGR|nr:hypothetical protein QJS04_geneDACA017178 [Acorus gramineus]
MHSSYCADPLCGGSTIRGEAIEAQSALAQEKNSESESSIDKQDFRPTAPGHSPGIGHSLKNKGVDKNV